VLPDGQHGGHRECVFLRHRRGGVHTGQSLVVDGGQILPESQAAIADM
jgi:hypothetical protein